MSIISHPTLFYKFLVVGLSCVCTVFFLRSASSRDRAVAALATASDILVNYNFNRSVLLSGMVGGRS